MQHQIAEIATQIEAARLLVYNAARLYESKIDFVKVNLVYYNQIVSVYIGVANHYPFVNRIW